MDIFRENCAKLAAHGRRKAKFAEGKEVKYISDVYSESIHYLNVHCMRKSETRTHPFQRQNDELLEERER